MYENDKKPLELDALTSLADDDTIVVGDTSDTSKVVKTINYENLKTQLESDLDITGGSSEWVVVSSNQTAANDAQYSNVASATYTDPTPSEGKGFIVLVRNGTATVGGTGYSTAGTLIYRVFHSGSWANYVYQVSSTFALASHTHAIADVTGLQTALDEKVSITATTPIGTINSVNTSFTVTAEPKWVVSDGITYFDGAGYTYAALSITMDVPPSQYIRAII